MKTNEPIFNCSLCHKKVRGYGNDPYPLKGKKCCDECNIKYVIPERLKQLAKERNK